MTSPNLRYTLTADDKASKVFAGVRKELQSVQGASVGLKNALTGFAPGIAAAFSVGAIGAFVRNAVNGIDALNDLADATGASIENLSALEDVAARTGTSMDTVGGAVIKLNKTLADAKPGSAAAAALTAIGVSAKELKNLDPAEALRRVAVALAGYADDGNKARLSQELFGKSLREVAPLLNDLAAQGQLNATVTTAQAKAAEQFNQQLSALQKNVVDAARAIAGPLVSALNGVAAASQQNGGLAKLLGLDGIEARVQTVVGAYRLLGLARERISPLEILKKDPTNERALAELARIDAKAREIAASATAAKNALIGIGSGANAGGGRGFINPESVRPSLPADIVGDAKPKLTPASQAVRAIAVVPVIDPATLDAIRALEATDVAKIAQLNAQLTALFTLQRETRGTDPGVAQAITATREALEKLDPAAQAALQSTERLNAILAATPTGQLQSVLADIEIVNKAFSDGAESTELWAEAIKVATAKAGSAVADEADKMSAFALQAGRNIQDALGDTLAQTLQGNFRSIGDLWRNLLIDMAAQAAAAQLNNYLFGATFGGGGEGVGILGSLLSGARANGGPVSAGGAYLVGERGPEIVVPRSAGTVVPNGGFGGTTVVQHYHVNGDVSPQTVKLIEAMGSRVKADILRSSRTGGAYAGAY